LAGFEVLYIGEAAVNLGGDVWQIAFSPAEPMLAASTTGSVAVVRLVCLADGVLRGVIGNAAIADNAVSVAFSPDGQLLTTGADDGTIYVWRVSDGTLWQTLQGHASGVVMLTFSPTGRLLASGDNTEVWVWQTSDWTPLYTLKGHGSGSGQSWLSDIAFSPDEQLLVTADGLMHLWRASDGKLVQVSDYQPANRVAFSPDGRLLGTGDGSSLRLWGVRLGPPPPLPTP
jgi:WD40 repeat protein